MSRISVVIPCYNVEDYIVECLNSIRDQTIPIHEVFVVDNGSEDNTVSVIKEWSANHQDVPINLLKEERKGANYARNKGLFKSTGDWIQFLDADDILLPDKIEQQISLLDNISNAPCSMIVGAYKKIDALGNTKGTVIPQMNSSTFLSIFTNQSGITSSNLWSAENLKNSRGWNTEIKSSQETDLMFRLFFNETSFVYSDQANTLIRERMTGQISTSNPKEKWEQFINIRIKYLKKLQDSDHSSYMSLNDICSSYMISYMLILSNFSNNTYCDYKVFLKKRFKLTPVPGLNKKWISLIKLLGYKAAFRIRYITSRKTNA